MQNNIHPVSFNARMVFLKPKGSPNYEIAVEKTIIPSLNVQKKAPNGLLKFIFGIHKKTKLPTYKGQK